jgi:beta-lactamase class A
MAHKGADVMLSDSADEMVRFRTNWTDDMFMASSVLSRAAAQNGAPRYADAVARLLTSYAETLQRPDGLFIHAQAGPHAWGRGNGFAAFGMMEALTALPANWPARTRVLEVFRRHMRAMAAHQAPDGMWRQVVDESGSYRELTVTAMTLTAMARGVREGWLDASFRPVVDRAWRGLLGRVADDGTLLDVCTGTGAGPTKQYYLDRGAIDGADDRGGAMTLTAALEMSELQAQPARSSLQQLLETEIARIPARSGIWVKHLGTGEEAGIHGDDTFNSASVVKIPVLVLAFQLADQGKLSLDERVTIQASDVRGGSGVFRYHDSGLQPTLRDVLLQMVITSDNTATDIAIAKVGGVARVNAWLKERGYGEAMRLTQTTGDLFAKYRALPEGQSNGKTNDDRSYWLGELTPHATARMFEGIQRKTIASDKSCEDMLRMLRAQQAGSRRLPHFLTVQVAHKTGDFPPVLANDVGIIYSRSGPIVVSFFLNAITEPYGEAEDRMGRVAQRIVQYFERPR